jgi:hypothetical protein
MEVAVAMVGGLPHGADAALIASYTSANGASAGPDTTFPFAVNREPWHGQSQVCSAWFQATRQPMCVQTADRSVSAPFAWREAATFEPRTRSPCLRRV